MNNKIIIFSVLFLASFLTLVIGGIGGESHGLNFDITGSGPNSFKGAGVVINATKNVSLLTVTKSSINNGNNLTVYNVSGIGGYTPMQSSLFSGDITTLNFNLTAGQKYALEVSNSSGGSTIIRYIDSGGLLPINGTVLNWVNASWDGTERGNGDVFANIISLTYNDTLVLEATSNDFNASTYETSLEQIKSNFTLPESSVSSVNLIYNQQRYAATVSATGQNYTFTRSLDIPLVSSNRALPFFWNITFTNGSQVSTTSFYQVTGLINLSICGSTPQNIKYINFTFKNETTAQERVNASITSSTWNYWFGSGSLTKSLSYSNTNENKEYTFCFTPQDRTVYTDFTLNYRNAESEQRSYAPSTLTLTNNTNLKTLYLLPTLQGQYVIFQVINTAQQALEGVNVVVTRSGIGTIETGTTDSSGSVTFFLNPNFAYSFTFSKTGFTDFETEITPSQTAYTITMGGTSGATNVTNPQRGITYSVLPSIKTLNNGTTYNFNLTLNASYWILDSWGFTLQNRSGYVLASQSSTASSGGFLGTNLNTGENKTITMNYFWVINGQYNNATITWTIIDLSGNTFSIFQFFTDLSTYVTVGFFGLDNFGLALLTFFTIFIITGVMSYKFGINSPAAIMGFIFSLVLFFDVGLGLVPNPVGAIPHAPTFLIGIILVAMVFREVGR